MADPNREFDRRAGARLRASLDELAAAGVVVLGLVWRLWRAHATFFNTDEAWHFSVANQNSLSAVYKASLTLAHPPLLVFISYFWRHLGTSELMLRLPGVVAGTVFCWVFYKWLGLLSERSVAWVGLILAVFLPPMIALSAELRQYSWMLMFAVSAAYFLERALACQSASMMGLSSVCVCLAMLSHYSAFLFAACLGIYAMVRMLSRRPPTAVVAGWAAGQAAGVGLAGFLYQTHIAKLSTVYPVAQPLERFGDFYLADWYFHAGRDRLLPFLYRGTFGVFRFIFGQTAVGQIAAVLFVAGVAILISDRRISGEEAGFKNRASARVIAVLLGIPFVLNWAAVAAGLYPYGRTRQCVFLAVFALAGVSVGLSRMVRNRIGPAVSLALVMVAACQAFGTLQGRDLLPLAEQRREYMEQALEFIRGAVPKDDVILTDKATSFQLRHYLCHQKPVEIEHAADGRETFTCDGLRVVSTGTSAGALTADDLLDKAKEVRRVYGLNPDAGFWVVQGGWASGLGESVRGKFPAFSGIETHPFGRYLEVFKLPCACS